MASDHVSWYLNQIGRVPLLTAEQEIQLGRQIQAMQELNGIEDLTPEQKRVKRCGERAYKKMFESNLRLVVNLAKKYKNLAKSLAFEDLISAGNFGLDSAVRKFDHSRGYKFSTYAYWWIRQSIHREMQQADSAIRLPCHQSERLSKIRRFTRDFQQANFRVPTKEEICSEFNMEHKELEHLLVVASGCVSLQAKANAGEGASEILDLIPDSRTEEEILENIEIQARLHSLPPIIHGHLTPRESEVIQLRFFTPSKKGAAKGLSGHTLQETGDRLGISRERVRQLESHAIRRMRLPLMRSPLAG